MIKKIYLKNYKCFKECKINLKNFNVLCGPNSSGKSSINQSILCLLQNNNLKESAFISNGKFVHFDEFEEIKNNDISPQKNVEIEIVNEGDNVCKMLLSSDDDGKIKCEENISEFDLLEEKNIYYLSANRIGPMDVYNKYSNNLIGQNGENAIGYLAKNQEKIIDEKYACEKYPSKDYNFLKEINYWLNEIIGEKINVKDLLRTDKSTATYSHVDSELEVRNKNTGTGLSYIISLLVMVFSLTIKDNNERPLFIIENPEIHLHPTAQLRLMDFLVFMSKYCQFMIETHSDYIVKQSLDVDDGQVIKLNKNFMPEYYNKESKFSLEYLTIGEIQWVAFDIPTIDFHIALFAHLECIFAENSINSVDDKIRQTNAFKEKHEIYDTKSKRYHNVQNAQSEYETLPVYLRNLIDHPVRKQNTDEPERTKYRDPINFNKALKESIKLMIEIIKEKER